MELWRGGCSWQCEGAMGKNSGVPRAFLVHDEGFLRGWIYFKSTESG